MMDLTGVTGPIWIGDTSQQQSQQQRLPLETARRRRRHVVRRPTTTTTTVVALWENDSIETILQIMETHQQSASVQERACAILGRSSRFNYHTGHNPTQKRLEIGAAGGIVSIVNAMKLHPQNSAVQQQACYALRHLLFGNAAANNNNDNNSDNNNSDNDNKRRVVQAQGVETVIKAMNNHTSDTILQRHACAVLVELCSQNNNKKDKTKRRQEHKQRTLVGKAGGAEAVIHAMKLHPNVPLLLLNACTALRNLSFWHKQNRIRIGQAGGIEQIVHTMQQHTRRGWLMEEACSAIAIVSCHNADNKRRVFQAGGVKAIVHVMEQQFYHDRVQDAATRALFILSFERHNKREIAQTATTEAIKEAQRRFPSLPYPPMVLQRLCRRRMFPFRG